MGEQAFSRQCLSTSFLNIELIGLKQQQSAVMLHWSPLMGQLGELTPANRFLRVLLSGKSGSSRMGDGGRRLTRRRQRANHNRYVPEGDKKARGSPHRGINQTRAARW